MSIDTNNKERNEVFDELFRQSLKNHRIPVDEGDWDRIRRDLRKRTAFVWLGRAGTAAAAVLLLFALYSIVRTEEEPAPENMTAQHEQNTEPSPRQTPQSATGDTLILQELPKENPPVTAAGRQTVLAEAVLPNPSESVASAQKIADYTASADSFDLAAGKTVSGVSSDTEQDSICQQTAVKQSTTPPADRHDSPTGSESETKTETNTKKGGKQWLLAATFGLSGSGGVFDNRDDLMYDAPASGNGYAAEVSSSITSLTDMNRDELSNIKHSAPFSLGFTVRKNISRLFGLESGVVYTLLTSRYQWSQYHVKQQLHYAGIPLNMVFSFGTGNRPLRFYLSAGVMAEKGVRAKYVQDVYWGNVTHTTTVKTGIDGLQWSLNASLGVKYRFHSGLGIYCAPYLSRYFDNGQPFSIRTNNPVFTGFHFGLNYEF